MFILVCLAALAQSPLDRLEREQLVPPVYLPATPIPFVSQPKRWEKPPLERAAGRQLLAPPTAMVPSSARLVEKEKGSTIARLAAFDQPPLGLQQDLPAAGRAWLASGALAQVSALKADSPQLPEAKRLLVDRPPTGQQDPAAAFARLVAQPLTSITRSPAPFLSHSIADPFQRSEDVRLREPPPEKDPPSASAVAPARPSLAAEAAAP